jgi:hypothetical protein
MIKAASDLHISKETVRTAFKRYIIAWRMFMVLLPHGKAG